MTSGRVAGGAVLMCSALITQSCWCVQDNLKEEMTELQQQLAFEKEEKKSAVMQVENLRKDVARIDSELEAFKASGASGQGDLNDLKQALEDKQTQLNAQIARVEELDSQVSRLSKEKDLINRKMDRVQQQKEAETRHLKSQLEASTGATQEQINERDRKINELVEELGDREVSTQSS
jgi:chromosome segregation ATPase